MQGSGRKERKNLYLQKGQKKKGYRTGQVRGGCFRVRKGIWKSWAGKTRDIQGGAGQGMSVQGFKPRQGPSKHHQRQSKGEATAGEGGGDGVRPGGQHAQKPKICLWYLL